MIHTLSAIEAHATAALRAKGFDLPQAASSCAWLHGVGYNGLQYLAEALQDAKTEAVLEKDLAGLDLQHVSCVFIAPQVEALMAAHGRLFLRNVRHGLYLLPGSVAGNYGIGCPVDPAFALGGKRHKNPYTEKLQIAIHEGVDVDEALWRAVAA